MGSTGESSGQAQGTPGHAKEIVERLGVVRSLEPYEMTPELAEVEDVLGKMIFEAAKEGLVDKYGEYRYIMYKCENVYIANIEGIIAVHDAKTNLTYIVDLDKVPGNDENEKINNVFSNFEYVLGCVMREVDSGLLYT